MKMKSWMRAASLVFALLLALAAPLPAYAHGSFWDDDANVHEADVEAIHDMGITRGCNPPYNDQFCPSDRVTRGQMAAFLARALALPTTDRDHFVDDTDSQFEAAINRLAEADITRGCNPPDNDHFCPHTPIPRDQMAALLDRSFVGADSTVDAFEDDDGSPFEIHINRLAAAGITQGCNPPDNTRYCPDRHVTRAEMASYLARAMGLTHTDPTQDDPEVVLTYSWGTRGAPDLGTVELFATRIHEALHSRTEMGRDGWNIAGRISFRPVPTGGDMRLWLTDDDDVGSMAPVCSDAWSCTVGSDLFLNDENFARATDTWADRALADYQRYVINHEVGHFLGFEARTHYNDPAYCGADRSAPVMMQQSIDLRGCETNVWPLGWERDCIEEVWLRDTIGQGGIHDGECPHRSP